jgi:hypothetical protein
MLPFTKRPGRGGDDEVITKDDLVQPSSEGGKPISHVKRSVPPPGMRPPAPSAGEDEMTTLIARSVTGSSLPLPNAIPAPLPAAGRPATVPPPSRSRPASMRPPPASMRPPPSSHHLMDGGDDEDDDDGRTVVRGAPSVVKRSSARQLGPQAAPASISPAAVIKATLESARRRDQLVPGPPSELLEDSADFRETAGSPKTPFIGLPNQPLAPVAAFDRTMPPMRAPFEGPPSHRPPASFAPPSSNPHAGFNVGPLSARAGARHGESAPFGNYPPAQTSYGPVPSASASVPGVAPPSMPAHFMTPQYSDPPGTAVTSGHKISGRPAISWAAALLGCGLLVGVAAVALLQGSDSAADTTASFVDPSRAPKAGHAVATSQPSSAPVTAATTPVPNGPSTTPPVATAPNPNAPPPGLIGASPVAPVPAAAEPAPPVAASPAGTAPAVAPVAAPPVVAAAPTTPSQGVAFAPVAVPSTPKAAAPAPPPPPKPAVAWKPASQPAAAPAPKPVAKAAPPVDEETAPKKTAKKGGKGGDADDETKKALEALQKAQLESASSFGQ